MLGSDIVTNEEQCENAEADEKFDEFVKAFVLEFEKKLEEYAKEADIGGVPKPGKIYNSLSSPVGAAVTVGTGFIPDVGAAIGRAVGGKAIEKGWQYFSGRNHRQKTKKVTQFFQKLKKDDLRRIFAETGGSIFYSFESQFRQIVDLDGNWKRGLKKLALDARSRIINHIYESRSVEDDISCDLLTESLIFGKSKGGLISPITPKPVQKIATGTKSGHTLQNPSTQSKWKTSDLYKNTGIIVNGPNNTRLYYRKKGFDSIGYRFAFSWEQESGLSQKYEATNESIWDDGFTLTNGGRFKSMVDSVLAQINKKDTSLLLGRIENGVEHTTEKINDIDTTLSEMGDVIAKREDLSIVKEQLHSLQATIKARLPAAVKRKVFNVKEPVKNFTGRSDEIEILHMALTARQNQVVVSQCASVSGLGGIGKSELARKYAYEHHGCYGGNVMWIDSETTMALKTSFYKLAEKLDIETTQKRFENGKLIERDIHLIVEDIYDYFADMDSLFIFDNVDQYEDICDVLPSSTGPASKKPAILITSRNSDWDIGEEGDIDIIMLEEFTPAEALEFVKKALDVKPDDSTCDHLILELTQKLCHFPLALRQAASYIKCMTGELDIIIEEYLCFFNDEEQKSSLLKHKPKRDRYTETTYTTWQITFKSIEKDECCGQLAISLLEMMAYLAPDEIALAKAFIKVADNESHLNKAIELLLRYSLITLDQDVANMHRLVQQIVRLWLKERNQEEPIIERTLRTLQNQVSDSHIAALWSYASKYEHLVHTLLFENDDQQLSFYVHVDPFIYLVKDGNVKALNRIFQFLANKEDLWEKLHQKINDGISVKCIHIDRNSPPSQDEKTHIASLFLYHAEVANALKINNCNALEKFLETLPREDLNSWFSGHTALYRAAESGDLHVVKMLLAKGADVNCLGKYNDSALHVALDAKRINVAKYLLENKVDWKIANIAGRKAIHYAADSGYLDIVRQLGTSKEECDSSTAFGWTPLHCAAKRGHLDIIELLLQSGANVNAYTNKGQTAYHVAAETGSLDVIKYLVNNNLVDVNLPDRKHDPVLNTAVSYGRFEVVKFLLGDEIPTKANVNAFNVWGATPLFQAILNYHLDIAKYLIEKGAVADSTYIGETLLGKFQLSPLHLAAAFDSLEIVTMLVEEKRANIDMGLDVSFSPLQVAKYFGSKLTIEYLIDKGACQDERSNSENIVQIFRSFFKDTKSTGAMEYISYIYRPERLYKKFENLVEFQKDDKMKNFVDRLQVAYTNLTILLQNIPSKWPQF